MTITTSERPKARNFIRRYFSFYEHSVEFITSEPGLKRVPPCLVTVTLVTIQRRHSQISNPTATNCAKTHSQSSMWFKQVNCTGLNPSLCPHHFQWGWGNIISPLYITYVQYKIFLPYNCLRWGHLCQIDTFLANIKTNPILFTGTWRLQW